MPFPTRPPEPELAEQQQHVYDTLRAAMPCGFDRAALVQRCGNTAVTRVGELRAKGADIPVESRAGKAYYRLASLSWLPSNRVTLGLKAVEREASGLTVELYEESRGKLRPDVEERLLARVREAMEEALATLEPDEPTEDDRIAGLLEQLAELRSGLEGLGHAVRRRRTR